MTIDCGHQARIGLAMATGRGQMDSQAHPGPIRQDLTGCCRAGPGPWTEPRSAPHSGPCQTGSHRNPSCFRSLCSSSLLSFLLRRLVFPWGGGGLLRSASCHHTQVTSQPLAFPPPTPPPRATLRAQLFSVVESRKGGHLGGQAQLCPTHTHSHLQSSDSGGWGLS